MTEKKPPVTLCKLLTCENAVVLGLHTEEDFVAGLECEIESVLKHPDHPHWQMVNDGSLRNSGYEYLSKPMKRKNLVESFKELHTRLKVKEEGDPFSYRTSTHVHVNVSSMAPSAVRNMVLLYALFEPCFLYDGENLSEETTSTVFHCRKLTSLVFTREILFSITKSGVNIQLSI
jgi:hypothetical protein